MARTTLKKEDISDDLNSVKTKIAELETERRGYEVTHNESLEMMKEIDKEIAMLKDKAAVDLGLKTDRTEGKVIGGVKVVKEEKAEKKAE